MPANSNEAPRARILVVEDSAVFREMQTLLLAQAGFIIAAHASPQAALAVAARENFDLVVIDYELPEMNGEQLMVELRKLLPDIAVIFVSGTLTLELAIKLSQQRVAGIFHKPANPKLLLEKVNETLFRAIRDTAVSGGSNPPYPRPDIAPTARPAEELAFSPRFLVGESDAFREFTHRIWKVRDFRSILLLQGEEGSPFELIARELTHVSTFREGPVMVCGPKDFETRRLMTVLAPSLLAPTAGTLIVTGVETFTAEQQNTLENLTTGRDGFLPFARRFRLVLAATPALTERVDAGAFGDVLFYKISALALNVPALRETRTDIPKIALRILQQARTAGGEALTVTALLPDAIGWLQVQTWDGGYAEMERTVLAAAVRTRSDQLGSSELEAALRQPDVAAAVVDSAALSVETAVGRA